MSHRLTSVIVACAALVLSVLPAHGQVGSSDFDPRNELSKLMASSPGYQKVRNLFYLGDLTSRSGHEDVARRAFHQAVLTYRELDGNQQRLAAPWAAQSMLGVAGLNHFEFRSLPLRWETFREDSSARWDLMTETRAIYNSVFDVGYARATFEALYLRAHLLEEWDRGDLDRYAENDPGLPPLERGITHLNVSQQLTAQAHAEYQRVVTLHDSLGLTGGTGDGDVARWVEHSQERLAVIDAARDSLAAREEALQALYAERMSAEWVERAVPQLWERAAQITEERYAGDADPWLDYWLQYQLVNEAFRPFLFGETGFYTRQRESAKRARAVRDEHWYNQRLRWQRSQEWLDAEIARQLAWKGVEQLKRVPETIDTVVERLAAQADSLTPEWHAALRGMPPRPEIEMPPIPTFGGLDPRIAYGEDREAIIEEYSRFIERMDDVERTIAAYGDSVSVFVRISEVVTSEDLPPEMVEYIRLQSGLGATQTLLLDTLAAQVVDQVRLGLEKSRDAAVWIPPGVESVNAQQAIREYRTAIAQSLRNVAADAARAANRHERDAARLNRRAPAASKTILAERLNRFAETLRSEADRISPNTQTAASP